MKRKIEINDIRAVITLVNVMLIIYFGISIAWFGLSVSALGLIKDITIDRKLGGGVMHLANIILNIFLLII